MDGVTTWNAFEYHLEHDDMHNKCHIYDLHHNNVNNTEAMEVLKALQHLTKFKTNFAILQRKLSSLHQNLKPKQDTRYKEFEKICTTREGKGHLKRLLKDKDFNINHQQWDTGNTGLHLACLNQNMKVVQSLLDSRNLKRVNIKVDNL